MNYSINQRRKSNSKKTNSAKNIVLPSLNQKIFPDNHSIINPNILHNINNYEKNPKKLNKNVDIKITKPQILIKNKPYSGNLSNKNNNNINDIKIQKRNNIINSYERDILTANPALIGNKASFQNYKEDNNLNYNDNLRYDDRGIEVNYKENFVDNSFKNRYKFQENKRKKLFKKIGFGISKSSPRISAINIMPNLYENQKQRDIFDYNNKIKILFIYLFFSFFSF